MDDEIVIEAEVEFPYRSNSLSTKPWTRNAELIQWTEKSRLNALRIEAGSVQPILLITS